MGFKSSRVSVFSESERLSKAEANQIGLPCLMPVCPSHGHPLSATIVAVNDLSKGKILSLIEDNW
jgi:hypothetical protein